MKTIVLSMQIKWRVIFSILNICLYQGLQPKYHNRYLFNPHVHGRVASISPIGRIDRLKSLSVRQSKVHSLISDIYTIWSFETFEDEARK